MKFAAILKLLIVLNITFAGCVQANHWQDGMFTGKTDFGGKITASGNAWQWYPSSVIYDSKPLDKGAFSITKSGLLYQADNGTELTILEGKTSGFITSPKPGVQPAIIFSNSSIGSLRLPVKGLLSSGQYRYGEAKLTFRHVSAYQDSALENGWVSMPDLSDYERKKISRLIGNINGYNYHNEQDMKKIIGDNIFNKGYDCVDNFEHTNLVGAWLTTIKDVSVYFPGAEEVITQWQGLISPTIVYF
ncbi:hypothetical protein [Escherichia coli]|uniref:F4 family fimbrial subunit n=1 Tax=Escherichia coli TaxID=562 RepID=UPI000B7E4B33|nr:hypothetical protein [Escherichia coli]